MHARMKANLLRSPRDTLFLHYIDSCNLSAQRDHKLRSSFNKPPKYSIAGSIFLILLAVGISFISEVIKHA